MKAFGYLVRDFGFEHSGTTIVSYECSIDFRKAGRVAVSVCCEAGRLPWDPFPVPAAAVSAVLRQYAVALRACAVDFLNGDPSVVVEVQPAVDVAYRQALADEWREERESKAAYKKKMKEKAKKAAAAAVTKKARKG